MPRDLRAAELYRIWNSFEHVECKVMISKKVADLSASNTVILSAIRKRNIQGKQPSMETTFFDTLYTFKMACFGL